MKTKRVYVCQDCGQCSNKWAGQCGGCLAWNTLVEETQAVSRASAVKTGYAGLEQLEVVSLDAVEITHESRTSTGLKELDRVLGGGLVIGATVLIGGDPGIGKSTILLQTLSSLGERDYKVLYVTGEESLQQVKIRAQRAQLNQKNCLMLATTEINHIIKQAKQHKPQFMVIDSIQTMYSEYQSSAPGSVSQVRECAMQLVQFAKQNSIAVFLVGHVTKEGAIAGPRVLEHMVDTVLYFEGERSGKFRLIRAVKNRFGAVNELGMFAMTDKGLRQVQNPSLIFLSGQTEKAAGSVVTSCWEGSRPLLLEVQALVDESSLGNPRRVTVGLDGNRVSMLLAVLHRHGGVFTHQQDIFVNVVGGIRVTETAADLAVLAAVLSSFKNQRLPQDCLIFGEVGLAGEIRPVPQGQERMREAAKHGFRTAIIPAGNDAEAKFGKMSVLPVKTVADVLRAIEQVSVFLPSECA